VKSNEAYYELLEQDIIPVFKGHILNTEDLIIRKHILNLMCNFETHWKDESLNFNDLPEVLIKLKEFEHDELLNIEAKQVTVLEKGKPFIRNICMAFDVLLKRKKPDTQLFSMTI
jgi:oxygen-independent coproporphyrinogen-3 oxidase